MKNIIYKTWLFVVLITLVSCASHKPAVVKNEETTSITTTETVHDTILKTEIDSSYYHAYLDCKNGKVVVKDETSSPGKTLKKPSVHIIDNQLQVDCYKEAEAMFFKWKTTYTKEHQSTKTEVPVITNVLTWWQQTQIKLFWIVLSLIALSISFKVIKTKFF